MFHNLKKKIAESLKFTQVNVSEKGNNLASNFHGLFIYLCISYCLAQIEEKRTELLNCVGSKKEKFSQSCRIIGINEDIIELALEKAVTSNDKEYKTKFNQIFS